MNDHACVIILGPFEDDLSAITACDILAATAKAHGYPVIDEQFYTSEEITDGDNTNG